jgi:hypothetical protein
MRCGGDEASSYLMRARHYLRLRCPSVDQHQRRRRYHTQSQLFVRERPSASVADTATLKRAAPDYILPGSRNCMAEAKFTAPAQVPPLSN